ncbi:MAG TPA: type I glutamate--ammonia ligase [Candidatus Sulfotelmatobacter sp.]|nr:type I glutamate--ammonia ligase [Candidatus Sulfotelmatobacter sp.]
MKPDEVLKFIKDKGIQVVDLKFVDLPGLWQHFSVSAHEFGEDAFTDGVGFDGSSIRGFQSIHESDMLLVPDAEATFADPFANVATLSIICNVKDPVTGKMYSRDPRYIGKKAEAYLKSSGIAEKAYFGPEAEFYIFDSVRFDQSYNFGFYHIDSDEGFWNSGKKKLDGGRNLGYKPRYKEGYFPVPPMDSLQDIRSEMMLTLESLDVPVEIHHHEVGTAGQAEIDMRFDTLTKMGDNMMKYKYVTKNVALRHGKTVTFMPKPIFQDNGSGMHVHQSLWSNNKNIFYKRGAYADLSEAGVHYIGGLLAHSSALLALCAPTTNSYRRLVPGYEAPINLIYSQRNRSACVRIPVYSRSEKSKRLEFRCPDPAANPYLCMTAMLLAGLDGIEKKMKPPEPIDKDLYDLEPEEKAKVKSTPGSLSEVLEALERDHEFLLKGGVFTKDVIETWIEYKRKKELDPVQLRPHPYEFALYFDV